MARFAPCIKRSRLAGLKSDMKSTAVEGGPDLGFGSLPSALRRSSMALLVEEPSHVLHEHVGVRLESPKHDFAGELASVVLAQRHQWEAAAHQLVGFFVSHHFGVPTAD